MIQIARWIKVNAVPFDARIAGKPSDSLYSIEPRLLHSQEPLAVQQKIAQSSALRQYRMSVSA